MIKLVAMDMDGTITQHKSKLEEMNRNALEKLKRKYKIVIVGAGTCSRIHSQLELPNISIIGSYGMQTAEVRGNSVEIIHDFRVEIKKESICERVEYLRKKYQYEEYVGDGVEFHETGMITIPLLGTNALLADKLAFDPDRKKRRVFYNDVVNLFPEYTVFIGGTSSFDMAPKPYNKYYALKKYAYENNYISDEIVYIGDDYGIGGNDEQVYNSEIKFLTIDSYTDFEKVIMSI